MNFVASPSKPSNFPFRYPALMRGVGRGDQPVVLFITSVTGMRLRPEGFGVVEGGWIPAESTDNWEPFIGTITVSA